MTRRERERKIKMFGMIGMSILVIGSLATATYAWFVQRHATINTNTMTIVAPDEYSFYSYVGNKDPHTPTGSFEEDFIEVISTNKEAQTTFSGTYPGQSKIYCIKIASRNPEKPVSLTLDKLISNNVSKEGGTDLRVDANNGKKEINIGQAIDITSMSSEDGTGYYNSGTNSGWLVDVNEDEPLDGDVFDLSVDKLNEGTHANQTITLSTPLTIYSDTDAQDTWESIYVFFRVCFADDTSTLYREINLNEYNMPINAAERQFVKDASTGTSNCYAGLTFQLLQLTLDF